MIDSQKKWKTFLLIAASLLWFSGYIQREIQTFRGKELSDFYDFNVYYTAGLVARSETDRRLYSYREIESPDNPSEKIVVNPQLQDNNPDSTYGKFAAQNNSEGQYLYPPFFSMVMVPLTYLPYEKAKILWHFLIYVFTAISIFLTVKLFYKDNLKVAAISLTALAVAEFVNAMQDLFFGCNVSSLILVLIVAGIYLHKKYPSIGALFFALAVMIKLTPIVVVPLMIIRRQWRWLTAFVCWSVLFSVIGIWQLGWQNHEEFFTRVMPAMSAGVPVKDNRSLATVIYVAKTGKFLSYDEIRAGAYIFPEKAPLVIFKILSAVSFLGLLFFFWKKNKTDSRIYEEIILLILWSIIFSPVSLRYNYLIALSPILFLWLHPHTKQSSTFWLGLLCIATIMVFSIIPSYGLMLTQNLLLQMILFMAMPTGIILCMAYSLKMLQSPDRDFSKAL